MSSACSSPVAKYSLNLSVVAFRPSSPPTTPARVSGYTTDCDASSQLPIRVPRAVLSISSDLPSPSKSSANSVVSWSLAARTL